MNLQEEILLQKNCHMIFISMMETKKEVSTSGLISIQMKAEYLDGYKSWSEFSSIGCIRKLRAGNYVKICCLRSVLWCAGAHVS